MSFAGRGRKKRKFTINGGYVKKEQIPCCASPHTQDEVCRSCPGAVTVRSSPPKSDRSKLLYISDPVELAEYVPNGHLLYGAAVPDDFRYRLGFRRQCAHSQ
jgi:hypothetical protein